MLNTTRLRRTTFWFALFWWTIGGAAFAQVPHYADVPQQVYARGYRLGDHAENCRFTHDVASELHKRDARFGMLKKRPGQSQCPDATAVDAVLYLVPGGLSVAVDVIQASDAPHARPAWTLDEPRYTADFWAVPDVGTPAPNPGTPLPSQDLSPILNSIEVLSAQLDAEMQRTRGELSAQIDQVRKDIAEFRAAVKSKWDRIGGFVLKYIAPALLAWFGRGAL